MPKSKSRNSSFYKAHQSKKLRLATDLPENYFELLPEIVIDDFKTFKHHLTEAQKKYASYGGVKIRSNKLDFTSVDVRFVQNPMYIYLLIYLSQKGFIL